jgi:sarcosine oxidase subunit alpha
MPRLPDPRFAPDCTILVDGRRIAARRGEPVATALLSAGRPLLARSAKYHRPRGPFCLVGSCHACLVRVDGQPNRRACRTPCAEGLAVETQHAVPSAPHDLLGLIDLATPDGLDHHHLGISSLPFNRAVVALSRQLAGLGRLPEVALAAPATPVEERFDALVIGAGPAGLSAAGVLAGAGRRVLLADAEPRAGGRLRCGYRLPGDPPLALADEVASQVRRSGGEVALGASVLGLWLDGGSVAALLHTGGATTPRLVRPGKVLLCAGGTAVPPALEDGDRPGVHWGRGLAVALAEHGTLPGRRAVVLGAGEEAGALAVRLEEAGLAVARVAAAARVLGRGRVRALDDGGGGQFPCDTVAVVGPPAPATDLARLLGAPVAFDAACGAFAVVVDDDGRTGVPGLYAAGEVTGAMGAARAAEAGRRAGEAARG